MSAGSVADAEFGDHGPAGRRVGRRAQPGHFAICGKAGPRVCAAARRAAPPPRPAAAGNRRGQVPRFPARDGPHPPEPTGRSRPSPSDLQDRRVEITGPTDRKMIINALNSGANVYMADFEDANSPTWHNLIDGQRNLCRRRRRHDPLHQPGRKAVPPQRADGHADGAAARAGTCRKSTCGWTASRCRPRCSTSACSSSTTPTSCWTRAAAPTSTCPSWKATWKPGCGTTCSCMAQDELGIPRGSIRATVLIETIPAAFEMDEILYELREHSAGLNCGRWDYIFSIIKKFRKHPEFTMPDRAQVTHDHALACTPTRCWRSRPAIAAASTPSAAWRRRSPSRTIRRPTKRPWTKVRADKVREAGDGHDGTWVAHPGLVDLAKAGLRRPHARAQPDRPPPRRRAGDGRGPADRAHRARSPSAGCARTSTWASNTWPPGWRATAACRSTT